MVHNVFNTKKIFSLSNYTSKAEHNFVLADRKFFGFWKVFLDILRIYGGQANMISNFAHTTTSSVVLLNTRVVSIVFFSLIKGILV